MLKKSLTQAILVSLVIFSYNIMAGALTTGTLPQIDSLIFQSNAPESNVNGQEEFSFYANGIELEPILVTMCLNKNTKPNKSYWKNLVFHSLQNAHYKIIPNSYNYQHQNNASHVYVFTKNSRYYRVEKALGMNLNGGVWKYQNTSERDSLNSTLALSPCGINTDYQQKVFYITAKNSSNSASRTVQMFASIKTVNNNAVKIPENSNKLSFNLRPPLNYPDNLDAQWEHLGVSAYDYNKPGAEFHVGVAVKENESHIWWLFPSNTNQITPNSGQTDAEYGMAPMSFDKTVTAEYGKDTPVNAYNANNTISRRPFVAWSLYNKIGVSFVASGSNNKKASNYMPLATKDANYAGSPQVDLHNHVVYTIVPGASTKKDTPKAGYPLLKAVHGQKVFRPINLQNPDLPLINYYRYAGYKPHSSNSGYWVRHEGVTVGDGSMTGTYGFTFLGVTSITTDPKKGPPIAQAMVYQPVSSYSTGSAGLNLWGTSENCVYHNESANYYMVKALMNLYVAGMNNDDYNAANDPRTFYANGDSKFIRKATKDPLQIPPDVSCDVPLKKRDAPPPYKGKTFLCENRSVYFNHQFTLKGAVGLDNPPRGIFNNEVSSPDPHAVYLISGYAHWTAPAEGYGCNPLNWSSDGKLLYISGIDTYGNYFYQAYEPIVAPADLSERPHTPAPFDNQ